jgi:hypothetical protein
VPLASGILPAQGVAEGQKLLQILAQSSRKSEYIMLTGHVIHYNTCPLANHF